MAIASIASIASGSALAATQQAKLTPLQVSPPDTIATAFGFAVDISGETIVVGSYGRNEAGLVDSGAAHVFVRSNNLWSGQARLLPSLRGPSFQFGYSVAISNDTIVAGCNSCTIAGQGGRGAVFVFTRVGTTWTQSPDSPISFGSGGDNFGHSVAIDGDTFVAGAPNVDVSGRGNEGAAYVYVRNGATWTLQQVLNSPAGAASDFFGESVAIRGNRIAVGANGDDVAVANQGGVYVFERSGTTWTVQPNMPLFVPPPDGQNPDGLGKSVSFSPSGDLLLAGAPGADPAPAPIGAAYLFYWNGSSWSQQRKFSPFSPNQGEAFGQSVAISEDTVIVGAFGENLVGTSSGTAYQFDRTGFLTWTAVPPQYNPGDTQSGQEYGRAVAISGTTAVVGAWRHDVAPHTDMGAAYVYAGLPGTPIVPPTLTYGVVPNTEVQVAASQAGTTPTATISVTATGGSNGSRSLACTVPPGYSVVVTGSPFVSGGSSGSIALGCTPATGAGTLSCTESPGGIARAWPLTCRSEAVYTSQPRPSSALAAYGTLDDDFATATLAIANAGTATLSLSNCSANPAATFGGLTVTPSIAAGASGSIAVSCIAPAFGTTLSGSLNCSTSDPARPSVLYKLYCVAPPAVALGAASSPVGRIASPTPDPQAQIGTSASLALDAAGNEILVVGAPQGGGDDGGRVLLFVRAPGSQAQAAAMGKRYEALGPPTAILSAPRGTIAKGVGGNKFGQSVVVARDGARIAVGTPGAGSDVSGRVFEFTRPGGGWSDLASLTPVEIAAPPAEGIAPMGFGSVVAYGEDGSLVVGAPASSVDGVAAAGAAYLFDPGRSASASLVPTTATADAAFGSAVGLASGLLAVGAPGEDGTRGAAYLFEANAGSAGPANRQTAAAGEVGDKFGASVAVTYDSIAVGASGDDTAAGLDSGSATLMRRLGTNAVDAGLMLAPNVAGTRGAGASLATNGELLVVGAPLSDAGGEASRGRAIVFDLDEALRGASAPLGTYENAIGDENDQFARAVAISRIRLLVGAPLGDEGVDAEEGRADPFVLDRISRGGFER